MTVFLSGGCKNGKSTLAEQIAVHLSRPEHLYYLATMIPHDEEDRLRIARHVQSRAGLGFQTVECGLGLEKALEKADPAGSYLLDSVTALLSNEMFRPDGSVDLSAPERVAGELTTLCRRLKHIVFVSDYIYSDALRYGELTEEYRRGLAYIDRCLAAACDTVAEVSFGWRLIYKGEIPV